MKYITFKLKCDTFCVRLSEETVLEDLSRLHSRVETLRVSVQTDSELEQQMRPFIKVQSHYHSAIRISYLSFILCIFVNAKFIQVVT